MLSTVQTQVDLKRRYAGVIRRAIVASLVVHAMVFVLSPPFSFRPYRMDPARNLVAVDFPEDIEIPKPPADPQPPDFDVKARVDADAPGLDYPDTSPKSIGDLPIPPPPVTRRSQAFLAFEEPPVLIHFERPVYPDLARQAGFEGSVLVLVLVNEAGEVVEASVTVSDVSEAMEQAAVDAARRCRFRPARQRTKPVPARVVIPFDFRLN